MTPSQIKLLTHLYDLERERQIILRRQEVTIRWLRRPTHGRKPVSWAMIGAQLGISRQAAHQTYYSLCEPRRSHGGTARGK